MPAYAAAEAAPAGGAPAPVGPPAAAESAPACGGLAEAATVLAPRRCGRPIFRAASSSPASRTAVAGTGAPHEAPVAVLTWSATRARRGLGASLPAAADPAGVGAPVAAAAAAAEEGPGLPAADGPGGGGGGGPPAAPLSPPQVALRCSRGTPSGAAAHGWAQESAALAPARWVAAVASPARSPSPPLAPTLFAVPACAAALHPPPESEQSGALRRLAWRSAIGEALPAQQRGGPPAAAAAAAATAGLVVSCVAAAPPPQPCRTSLSALPRGGSTAPASPPASGCRDLRWHLAARSHGLAASASTPALLACGAGFVLGPAVRPAPGRGPT